MANQEKGEHSRRGEPNEDEKPLKKARYVWEVKGKYHLKDTYKNNNTINKNNNTEASLGDNHKKSVGDDNSKSEQPVEDKNNSAKNQNESCSSSKCCIESFLAKTEAIMDSDVDDDDVPMNSNIDCNILNEIPVTLVTPLPINQDYYLRKWQARQIARGFVDNTINSVLETWKNPPFDAADFVENCQNDGQVEDDAILMAIQSHGLQSSLCGNLQFPNSTENKDIAFIRSPEIEESTLDNFENYQNELIKEQEQNSSPSVGESMSSCSSISNAADEGSLDLGDPMDFLDAAVSVAIQKKGLSYGY